MATLRYNGKSELHLPIGDGFPKGAVMVPGTAEVTDLYAKEIQENSAVRIWLEAPADPHAPDDERRLLEIEGLKVKRSTPRTPDQPKQIGGGSRLKRSAE